MDALRAAVMERSFNLIHRMPIGRTYGNWAVALGVNDLLDRALAGAEVEAP